MAELGSIVFEAMRVPPEPAPPPGDPATLRTFRASDRFFRYNQALWLLKQAGAVGGLIVAWVFVSRFPNPLPWKWVMWGEYASWALFVAQLPLSYILLRLDFEFRWYMLTDRSLRIRDGILVVREKTMAFANVQNITIRQNPLQRLFGIGTVAVRAAGGGSGGSQQKKGEQHSHEALFEGVDNADEIRDLIRQRIRQHRDSGLGDPDDVPAVEPAGVHAGRPHGHGLPVADSAGVLTAAQRVLDEVRALRQITSDPRAMAATRGLTPGEAAE